MLVSMTTVSADSWIAANWPAPANIKAVTTVRSGGFSEAPFDSLNLGAHVGDDASAVLRNRAVIRDQLSLPSEPAWLQQSHSTRVINLNGESFDGDADGSISQTEGIVCCVMTADCLPLLLTNQAGSKVAALHVGWRGLADGIIETGLELFAQPPSKVIAYAGPAISIANFEVGLEVRDELGGSDAAYNFSAAAGKCYADLYQLTRERLSALGVENFNHGSHCTYRDEEQFFSYRRDGQSGRMASLVWIEKT